MKERAEKDKYFKTNEESPIPKEKRRAFRGLKYFPPTEKYIFKAEFLRSKKPDTVSMATTKKEKIKKMLKYGKLSFHYIGKPYTLSAYIILPVKEGFTLFVPFNDLTNDKETYYGGRYLDLDFKKNSDYVLDFNSAYNPYCCYNTKYSCPLVPAENSLPFDIRAGEKK